MSAWTVNSPGPLSLSLSSSKNGSIYLQNCVVHQQKDAMGTGRQKTELINVISTIEEGRGKNEGCAAVVVEEAVGAWGRGGHR